MALSFPLFLFVNIHQTVKYRNLEKEVAFLEDEQQRLIEENKKALAAVALLASPERVEKIAVNELSLKPLDTDNRTQIYIQSTGTQ